MPIGVWLKLWLKSMLFIKLLKRIQIYFLFCIVLFINWKNNNWKKKNTSFFISSNLLHCYHEHNLYVNASGFHIFVNMEPHRLKYLQEQIWDGNQT